MTSLNAGVEILKTDRKGRVRVSKQRREDLLDEFERSGLSGAKFAELAGMKYATFANWAARRRQQRTQSVGSGELVRNNGGAVRLVEACVGEVPGRSPGGLQIDLPGGARLQVGSPLQLQMAAELLRMLSSRVRGGC
jgi:hypothetical protein